MMNEQHIFCYAYYEGGYFYAKKQISRRYFHNYHGVRDGLYHDLLQHCSQRRRNEQPGIFKCIPRAGHYGPIAFILDFFLIGPFAKKKAFSIVNLERDNNFHLVIAISVVSIIGMCPLMSLAATLLFKNAGTQFISVWFQTTAINFPMAFFWQLCFAGPLVRKIFTLLFPEKETSKIADGQEA